MNAITFSINPTMTVDQFIDILQRSGLAGRRPIDDHECLASMLTHSNLLVGAYVDKTLVGVARCVTDFAYCCYLSDLAVDQAYQHKGIGIGLQQTIKDNLKPRCKVILLSAPAAMHYYPKIGYTRQDRCFTMLANDALLSNSTKPLDPQ